MKQLFLFIYLIFVYLINTSFCQVYPSGEIKDIQGNCLTSPNNVGEIITIENCFDSQSTNKSQQQWIFSLGNKNVPTLQSLNGLCAEISNNNLITIQCTTIYKSSSFLSVRYIEGSFIIKSVMSQSCLQSPFKIGESPFFTYNCDADENQKFFIDLTSKSFLKFNTDCTLTISDDNSVLWKNVDEPPSVCKPSAVLKLHNDGKLCIYNHENNPVSSWCSDSKSLGGRYYHMVLMEKVRWGLVIQSENGAMVWAKWGESIYPDANYNLIPGSYFDENYGINTNKYITNGRDFLYFNIKYGLQYFIGNPNMQGIPNRAWSSIPEPSYGERPVTLTLYINNDNVTIQGKKIIEIKTRDLTGWKHILIDVTLWNTQIPLKGCKFIHLPILNQNDYDNWGWVIKNKGLKIIYGNFNYQPTKISSSNNFLIGSPTNPLNPTKQLYSDILKFELRPDGVLEFRNLITGELLFPYSYSSVLIPTSGNGTNQCPNRKYLGYWDNDNNLSIKVVGCEKYRDTCNKTDSIQCRSNPQLCNENDNNKCFTYFTFFPNCYQFGQASLVIQYGLPEIMFISYDNILVSNYLY
ncbi:hypothetical protein DDB_G0284789 [Dictyostelium discoideum AX4]|uniref:Uncharacterized protein n=1 Tax=Dictyostelium discoideum TaxID=44689 RepID=Q54P52_DICDI|nr:hypothetical protein DDB_G0284789 [Dictyostelium discoideum AX4]EAL65047.1 hypothetical protein DDB_G0284789 [Dictyostelium discoideum AX4]|eukprot:XP_638406.1 hypothetical protein DDB_G0284789 [Dictyostelium discoideum AX4]